MLCCSPGYFKTVFLSQYGPKTGPETGNFYATGAKRSLMGRYCDPCSRAAINISSTGALIRKKGREDSKTHIGWVKKIQGVFEAGKASASVFNCLMEGDAATSSGAAMPILVRLARKFVTSRVGFKIMQLAMFSIGHATYCLRAATAPWVQGNANLQIHCMAEVTLPQFCKHYLESGRPVPGTHVRWSDGGGGTWNLTLLTFGYLLVKMGIFKDVKFKRPQVYHSHNVWGGKVAGQQCTLLVNPGHGALTEELLMEILSGMANSGAAYVDQALGYTSWLNHFVFKDFKHYREAELWWPHGEEDGSATVRCAKSTASKPEKM
jgi:hypothetical protein